MVKTNGTIRRTGRRPGSQAVKTRPSTKKANAAGYAKRVSRKSQAFNGLTTDDVYEYTPEKARRSKIKLDLDRDEATDWGVGPNGEVDGDRETLRARLIGENDENEKIDSEDDEDIDSDAAFEESDDEQYAGFFKKQSGMKSNSKSQSIPKVRFEVDLNEDDDEEPDANPDAANQNVSENGRVNSEDDEEEDADDEFYDLLDIIDGRAKLPGDESPEDGQAKEQQGGNDGVGPTKRSQEEYEDDSMSQDEGLSDDEEADSAASNPDEKMDDAMDFTLSDDENVAPGALDDLQNFISNLETSSKKRKGAGDEDTATQAFGGEPRARKRRALIERTAAGTENEFSAQGGGTKLNLDDLLAPLANQSSALQSLKRSTKGLTSSKTKTLSAPLPQRAQERLDREAAYEQTKEEVQKWAGTMKRIREAEHLSFPLQAPTAGRVSNLELAAKFKPSTQLESAVDALLKSAKMREQDIEQTEDTMLQMNKLSVEEVAQRRAELRKMRELMFRAEVKAKRIAKIKSKTYRKLKRKERAKLGEKIDEQEDEGDEESRLKMEYERAKERATLKHKYTGKWAKKMKGREGLGEETRRDIEDMLDRGEKLRKKIQGLASDESEADHDESEDDEDDENGDGVEKIKQTAFDEIQALHNDSVDAASNSNKGKGVFEMKFMKDAMARHQRETNKIADEFFEELGAPREENSDDDEVIDGAADAPSGVIAVRAGGRVVYRPGASVTSQPLIRPMGSLASDTSSVTLKSTDLLSPPPSSPEQHKRPTVPLPNASEVNPWLVPEPHDSSENKVARKHNEVVVSKESNQIEKSKNKLKKLARRREEEKAKAKEDAIVEISTDKVLALDNPTASAQQSMLPPTTQKSRDKGKPSAVTTSTPALPEDEADDDSDAHSELEEQEKLLMKKGKNAEASHKGLKAFEQRELVALAFAGDNVVKQFEETKKRAVAEDAPREVDTTLPGWGSWGGVGTRKAPPKPHLIKRLPGIDSKSRADYGKAHVIISEKRDKKAAKYLVKDLPYPYTSQAQFERSMERPLGVEWNTRVGFQRATLPKVVKKPGVIIDPLEKQHN